MGKQWRWVAPAMIALASLVFDGCSGSSLNKFCNRAADEARADAGKSATADQVKQLKESCIQSINAQSKEDKAFNEVMLDRILKECDAKHAQEWISCMKARTNKSIEEESKKTGLPKQESRPEKP